MKRRLRELWVSFERDVLPADAPDVQRIEMRRAFYAGGFALFDTVANAMSNENEMTAEDERVMIDLSLEREEYLQNMRLGRA